MYENLRKWMELEFNIAYLTSWRSFTPGMSEFGSW